MRTKPHNRTLTRLLHLTVAGAITLTAAAPHPAWGQETEKARGGAGFILETDKPAHELGAAPSLEDLNRYKPKVNIQVANTNPTAQLLANTLEGTGLAIINTKYGPLNCPVNGDHHFISSWGFARDGGKRRHKGNDIFAKRGTPLVAMGDGVVESMQTYDRRGSLGGIWIKLRLDSGMRIYYAHLDSIAEGIRVGDRVTIGQTIGYVGDTGNAKGTDPHLHIEIKPPGKGVTDPYPILSQLCAGAR